MTSRGPVGPASLADGDPDNDGLPASERVASDMAKATFHLLLKPGPVGLVTPTGHFEMSALRKNRERPRVWGTASALPMRTQSPAPDHPLTWREDRLVHGSLAHSRYRD